MTDPRRLAVVRAVHTAIYLVMASAVLATVYGGVTGAHGLWLWIAAGLAALESLIFAASGMKCPLTAIAVKYGAGQDGLFDTFLPEPITRHTLRVFGPLLVLGFALMAMRGLSWGWRA